VNKVPYVGRSDATCPLDDYSVSGKFGTRILRTQGKPENRCENCQIKPQTRRILLNSKIAI
jgi:hypothetical protein